METGIATHSRNSAAAIWGRLIDPREGNLTAEAARAWLRLSFPPEDRKRVEELNKKAQEGTLTAEEGEELDDYIRVSEEIAVIKAKARLSLKQAGLEA